MADTTPLPEALTAALRARRLEVTAQGDDALVVQTSGAGQRQPRIELATRDAAPPQGQAQRRWVRAFGEGVAATLHAPRSVSMAETAFTTAAGQLMMSLVGPGFCAGVAAAGGEPPLEKPWFDDLTLVYWLDLGQGRRVLSQPRFEAWGVSRDQIHCGARSILFHHSRHAPTAPVSGDPQAVQYAVGDGYDSGRAILLEELRWEEAVKGLYFGVPEDGRVMLRPASPEALEPFRALVERAHAAAQTPLSARVYEQRGGAVTPVA